MATRLDYRNKLKDKLLGIEDEGYGDFEYTDPELNTYLELAVARLYPAVYKRIAQAGLALTSYGTVRAGSLAATSPERVFLVEDDTEREAVYGWKIRPTSIVGINRDDFLTTSTFTVYYHDAHTLPADDTTDAGIPAIYTPLVVLGALVEALESRHDTGVRPDPTAGHGETQLVDRLTSRYERLKDELAMSLPVITV